MRSPIVLQRPQRQLGGVQRLPRPEARARPVVREAGDPDLVAATRGFSSLWRGTQFGPYLDYRRSLTAEGGILIVLKDLDVRLRRALWRAAVWSASTGAEGWFVFTQSPAHSTLINVICFIAVALINWLIVAKKVEIYRHIEVRPDCLILEGKEVFWLHFMDGGWPTFQPDDEGNQILCGIYGTRFVEFLTVRRFDELDRAPEVFAAQLQDAMKQLWDRPG